LLDEELAGTGNLPLGLDDESPHDQFSVAPGRGDVIRSYTDAPTEAADPSGRMLGEDGLLELGVYSKVFGSEPAVGRAHPTKKNFH
jgi:phosphoserine phosphatase RsbU/P